MWRNSSGGSADREHHPFHHQGTKQRNQREGERACSRAETHQLLEENRGRQGRAEPNLPDFYYGISIIAGVSLSGIQYEAANGSPPSRAQSPDKQSRSWKGNKEEGKSLFFQAVVFQQTLSLVIITLPPPHPLEHHVSFYLVPQEDFWGHAGSRQHSKRFIRINDGFGCFSTLGFNPCI